MKTRNYTPEMQERAVRMLIEAKDDYPFEAKDDYPSTCQPLKP